MGLRYLCFEIFKQYLEENDSLGIQEIETIFNNRQCNNKHVIVLNPDWSDMPEGTRKKYFSPITYDGVDLYFTTQWENNGGDCDNIDKMIALAKDENYDIEIINEENLREENPINKIKNIILYGSPGVGKTHNTNKLIKLIESGKAEQEIFKEIKENKKETIELDDDIKSRTKFVTFHQSFGYEDFIEGFRPNEEGKIELVDGIFKNICKEAQANLDNSQSDKVFNFDRFLSDFIQEVEAKEMFQIDTNLTITVKKKTNGDFQSFKVGGRVKNQSLTKDIIKRDFELFLNRKIIIYQDIQPTFESQSQYHGNAPYYFKLYEAMKEYLDTTDFKYESNKSDLQNYYLVIDEINRGNISKIFGELITLIEEDKRDILEVTLPYSKQPFKIPSNLYIIGTMNSSDKSIALIDIALRRRFTFLKMEPNADLIDDNEAKALFIALNEHIKKSHLGEDYQIGHSYFMGIESLDDLDFVWDYKIKPLLEEYFYGDKEGFDEVLGHFYNEAK